MPAHMHGHMRGVSATSLTAVITAVESTQDNLSTVGDELFAVAGVLDATPAVRRVLSDPASEPEARAGLLAQVLGDKVSSETLAVLDAAARGKWASGRDVSDAVELAGLAAHVAAAANEDALDAVEQQLFEAQRIIGGERELRGVLLDRTLTADHKATLIGSIFGDKVNAATLALLKQAAANRSGSFDRVLAYFADEVAARRNRTLAEVRTAVPLEAPEQERLRQALSKKYGKEVHLNTIVDPTIVGGLKVSIGDDVIDGSISGRLEDARRQMAG
jgi:F-type H+-transporting ATPase subunit delta